MMTSHMKHVPTHLAVLLGVLKHVEILFRVAFGILMMHVATLFVPPFGVLMHSVSHLTAPFGVSPPWTSRVIFCLGIKVKRSLKFY